MPTFLTIDDLLPFAEIDAEKAEAMIDDATAMSMLVAPCLGTDPTTLTASQQQAVKAILRGAVLRWHETGTGALQSESIGGYSYTLDNRQARKSLFWPSEITQLRGICQSDAPTGAFSIDTTCTTVTHADICALNFGALYCSCGAVLTGGWPLYETDCP
jgi:hypothetical protein